VVGPLTLLPSGGEQLAPAGCWFPSAWWFDGWEDASWKVGIPPPEVRTVAAAETWLLRVGWKRSSYGLLSITEIPPAGRR
jgi:hypothetical protein